MPQLLTSKLYQFFLALIGALRTPRNTKDVKRYCGTGYACLNAPRVVCLAWHLNIDPRSILSTVHTLLLVTFLAHFKFDPMCVYRQSTASLSSAKTGNNGSVNTEDRKGDDAEPAHQSGSLERTTESGYPSGSAGSGQQISAAWLAA